MAKKFAQMVMSGQWQAIMLAMLFAIIPGFIWVSVVIVSLVILRKGVKQGLIVLAWAVLPVIGIGAYQGYPFLFVLLSISLSFGLTGFLAITLRLTGQWRSVLFVGVIVASLSLSLMVHNEPDYIQQNQLLLERVYQAYYDDGLAKMPLSTVKYALHNFAKFLPGLRAVTALLSGLLNLVMARAMQASLYHPGGLRDDL